MTCQGTQVLSDRALDGCRNGPEALYARALESGRRGQFWAALTGRPRELLSLGEIAGACPAQPSSGGARAVAIAAICGSEGRSADFDRDFNPLQEHTRDRWLGIAAARDRGRSLPPVALIQVGERYFVRDGHHRISVARALGQKTIEATVEVRQVSAEIRQQPATDRRRAQTQDERPSPGDGSIAGAIGDWPSGRLRPASEAAR